MSKTHNWPELNIPTWESHFWQVVLRCAQSTHVCLDWQMYLIASVDQQPCMQCNECMKSDSCFTNFNYNSLNELLLLVARTRDASLHHEDIPPQQSTTKKHYYYIHDVSIEGKWEHSSQSFAICAPGEPIEMNQLVVTRSPHLSASLYMFLGTSESCHVVFSFQERALTLSSAVLEWIVHQHNMRYIGSWESRWWLWYERNEAIQQ